MAPFGCAPEDHGYTVVDLIEQIPPLMIIVLERKILPPLAVLNDLFSRGECDSGMSGGVSWDVFQLNDTDISSIKNVLSEKYKIEFVELGELSAIQTFDDWVDSITSK